MLLGRGIFVLLMRVEMTIYILPPISYPSKFPKQLKSHYEERPKSSTPYRTFAWRRALISLNFIRTSQAGHFADICLFRRMKKSIFPFQLSLWVQLQNIVYQFFCLGFWYLNRVLSIVPPNKRPNLSSKLRPNLNLRDEIIGCGIIDKTRMCEAANHSGMKNAIWVKYPLSVFQNNYRS